MNEASKYQEIESPEPAFANIDIKCPYCNIYGTINLHLQLDHLDIGCRACGANRNVRIAYTVKCNKCIRLFSWGWKTFYPLNQ